MTVEEAFKVLEEKKAVQKQFTRLFTVSVLGEDLAPFDLVLDTDNLNANEVFEVLCSVIDNVAFSSFNV